jgi:type IV secretion system protein VirB11
MSFPNLEHSKVLCNILEKFEKYLTIPNANEIIINQPHTLFIDKNGEFIKHFDKDIDMNILENLVKQIANVINQQFNRKYPRLNTSIPGTKYRLTALHSSVLYKQAIQINIRIPPTRTFDLEEFTLSEELSVNYETIKNFVRQRKNLLIIGGTGSGKTQLLNALSKEISNDERIVTIEDSPEIEIENENKTQIIVSKYDDGAYTWKDGINTAMRISPQRILMGELDTQNTFPFLKLNNTGHSGAISTLHANSPYEAINSISANALLGHNIQDKESLKSYIYSAIDYIIEIQKNYTKKQRIITSILDLKNEKSL